MVLLLPWSVAFIWFRVEVFGFKNSYSQSCKDQNTGIGVADAVFRCLFSSATVLRVTCMDCPGKVF